MGEIISLLNNSHWNLYLVVTVVTKYKQYNVPGKSNDRNRIQINFLDFPYYKYSVSSTLADMIDVDYVRKSMIP